MAARYRLSLKENSIRQQKHFKSMFKRGRRRENNIISLIYAPKHDDHPRYAYVTSKKVGNAIVRNKCRRRLREFVRHHKDNLHKETDIIFRVKKEMVAQPASDIEAQIKNLLERNRLWTNR